MPENDMGNVSKISLEISVTSNAATQIQELSESINVLIGTFNKTDAPFKKIEEHFDNLAKSAKEVDSVMKGLKDVSKVASDVQHAMSNAQGAKTAQVVKKKGRPLSQSEANAAFEEFKSGIESGTIERTADNFKELERLANARAKAISDEEAAQIDKENAVKEATRKTNEEIKKQTTSTEETGKAAKKATPWWVKLGKQMGRIALYRAVRMVLKQIAQAAKEGVQTVALFDKRVSKSLSNITNTWKGTTSAFGSVLGELIIMFEPVITAIGEDLMNFANNLSMVLAKMNGSDVYNKAIKDNKKYEESLKGVSKQLLSFDKFETLNATPVNLVPGSVSEDWNSQAEAMSVKISTIKDLEKGLEDLLNILNGDWKSWWEDLNSGKDTLAAITALALGAALAFGIFKAATLVLSTTIGKGFAVFSAFIAAFELLRAALNQLNGPLKTVTGLFFTVAGAIWMLYVVSQLTKHAVAPWLAAAEIAAGLGIAIAGFSAFQSSLPKYATGGFPEDGLFYANHSELVGQFSNGRTVVANNQQIVEGIAEGIYPSVYQGVADAMKQYGGRDCEVVMDGQKVGRMSAPHVYNEFVRLGIMKSK